MANTYIPIATVTVGSDGASTIEFASIPQNYSDLLIKMSFRTNRSGIAVDNIRLGINGGGSNSISSVRNIWGNGSSVISNTSIQYTGGVVPTTSGTISTFGNGEIYIPNYSSSNNKMILTDSVNERNDMSAYQVFNGALWSNTSAITSITFFTDAGGGFTQYSTATLYGIKNS